MTTTYDWSRVRARPPEGLTVSAIVVSYRTGAVLFDALCVLLSDPDITEIVLVDNGNPPDVQARLARMGLDGRLRIVGEGINRGFGAGVNFGAAEARGDRLLILNPDALLRPGSLAALEAARQDRRSPIVVGGRIIGVDGVEQRGARRGEVTLASATASFLGLRALARIHAAFAEVNLDGEASPAGPVSVGAVSGAFMYLSRADFDRLQGFDEGYFLHVEDIDLCRRAREAGGEVIYTPHAVALHHGATSDAPSLVVERHKAAGFRRYFRKFARTPAEQAAAAVIGPALTAAILTRAWLRRRG
jgi:N-acetylglucosaminyl-diphospho-decaprenol L-rhamnosyltransferase